MDRDGNPNHVVKKAPIIEATSLGQYRSLQSGASSKCFDNKSWLRDNISRRQCIARQEGQTLVLKKSACVSALDRRRSKGLVTSFTNMKGTK